MSPVDITLVSIDCEVLNCLLRYQVFNEAAKHISTLAHAQPITNTLCDY